MRKAGLRRMPPRRLRHCLLRRARPRPLRRRAPKENVPVAGIALVVLGVLMLLHTLDLLNFDRVARYWPILLIAAGLYLLYGRFAGHNAQEGVRHERQ